MPMLMQESHTIECVAPRLLNLTEEELTTLIDGDDIFKESVFSPTKDGRFAWVSNESMACRLPGVMPIKTMSAPSLIQSNGA